MHNGSTDEEPHHLRSLRAERHPHADLLLALRHPMRGQGVEADSDQHEGHDRDRDKPRSDHVAGVSAHCGGVIECLDREDRQVRIKRRHLLPHGVDQRLHAGACIRSSDHKRHRTLRPRIGLHRHVCHGLGILLPDEGRQRLGSTDDREPRRVRARRSRELDPLPERVAAGEEPLGEPLVDDAALLAGEAVGAGQHPSMGDGKAHGFEIARPRSDGEDLWRLRPRRGLAAADRERAQRKAQRHERNIADQRRRCERRHCGEAIVEAVEEPLLIRPGGVLLRRKDDTHRDHALRIDQQVREVQIGERAHHQAGPAEQDHRERELGDDQAAGHPAGTDGGTRPSALFQRVVDVGSGEVPRRDEADAQARDQAGGAEEHPGESVRRQVHPVRHHRTARCADLVDAERLRHLAAAEDRQPKAKGAGKHGDQRALDQQLAYDSPP